MDDRAWLTDREFEDGIAFTNLLPGPASTQLAIYCAWRLRGPLGAVVGGLGFIVPGLILILALSAVFLAGSPPDWLFGAAAGAGAAVPAVALGAAIALLPASWSGAGMDPGSRIRWVVYVLLGLTSAAIVGPWLVIVLAGCGIAEVIASGGLGRRSSGTGDYPAILAFAPVGVAGGLAALAWVAFKVGALSYGGGFVIIPLIQHDAVTTYGWMTGSQFLNAVALGQITPGPVVQTVAVVGYAAAGLGGGLLAAGVAFAPSFAFVLLGGPHLDRLRTNAGIQRFFIGAGAAAVGAIAGSAVSLGLELEHLWQVGVLAIAAVWILVLRRNVVIALLGAGIVGAIAALAGAPSSG